MKPFSNFKTSILGLVPKSVPGEFRLNHHLSWPRTGDSSVNDGILLLKFLNKDSCMLRELQSLNGFQNFCCLVITCGRAFLRRLIDLTIGVPRPYYHIRLNNAVKADMNLWLSFCDQFNGKSLFLNEKFLTSDTLKLFTDSTKSLGFGAVYGSYWLYGPFPPEWKTFNITFQELYPIVLAVHIWAHRWKNHSILFLYRQLSAGLHYQQSDIE